MSSVFGYLPARRLITPWSFDLSFDGCTSLFIEMCNIGFLNAVTHIPVLVPRQIASLVPSPIVGNFVAHCAFPFPPPLTNWLKEKHYKNLASSSRYKPTHRQHDHYQTPKLTCVLYACFAKFEFDRYKHPWGPKNRNIYQIFNVGDSCHHPGWPIRINFGMLE